MNAWRRWLAAAVLAGIWLAGCNSGTIDTGQEGSREVSAPSTLMARANPFVTDVPVPVGFKLDEGKSRSTQAGGVRLVDHRYTGRVDKWDVGRFYKRQMPLAQRALNSDRMIQGTIFLTFSKGNEACDVLIADGQWWNTVVKVAIYPVTKAQAR